MKYYFSSLHRHSLFLLPLGFLMTIGIFSESASAASLTQLNVAFWNLNEKGNGKQNNNNDTKVRIYDGSDSFLVDFINLKEINGNGQNNDCSGLFGDFNDPCDVGQGLTPKADIAPIFAKLDTEDDDSSGGWTVNTNIFSSPNDKILTDGFTISNGSGTNLVGDDAVGAGDFTSGTWSFDGSISDLNSNFIGITHWSSKGSRGFVLSWMVDADDKRTKDVCNLNNVFNTGNYSKGCLNAAIAVNSGNWFLPSQSNGNDRTPLSHISFYGKEIPEPGTAIPAIFLFGLAGLYGHKKSTR